jgi:hypothetical protein
VERETQRRESITTAKTIKTTITLKAIVTAQVKKKISTVDVFCEKDKLEVRILNQELMNLKMKQGSLNPLAAIGIG